MCTLSGLRRPWCIRVCLNPSLTCLNLILGMTCFARRLNFDFDWASWTSVVKYVLAKKKLTHLSLSLKSLDLTD
jgi:hypothetical protein